MYNPSHQCGSWWRHKWTPQISAVGLDKVVIGTFDLCHTFCCCSRQEPRSTRAIWGVFLLAKLKRITDRSLLWIKWDSEPSLRLIGHG